MIEPLVLVIFVLFLVCFLVLLKWGLRCLWEKYVGGVSVKKKKKKKKKKSKIEYDSDE